MNGRKLGESSLKVLRALYKLGTETIEGLMEVHEYDKFVRQKIYRKLYYLEKAGYVENEPNESNASFFHLTPKGKLSILKYLHLEKLLKRKWDGLWRVIIFDIPERRKKWREYLRHDLKNLGFIALQESVYITPYPVTGELDKILKMWHLRKHFRYLSVNEIDGENRLKQIFNIK